MRDLRYGIEIEMTGLSRGKAAETLAGFFGTRAEHTGGGYDAYAVRDAQGPCVEACIGREHPDAEKGAWTNCCMQTVHTAWSW